MKLSEAILKGCETTEKLTGDFIEGDKACALGAGIVAIGKNKVGCCEGFCLISENFPISNMRLNEFPEGLYPKWAGVIGRSSIYDIIWRLNDRADWSREAIAMWVSTLEDYLESQEESKGGDTREVANQKAVTV